MKNDMRENQSSLDKKLVKLKKAYKKAKDETQALKKAFKKAKQKSLESKASYKMALKEWESMQQEKPAATAKTAAKATTTGKKGRPKKVATATAETKAPAAKTAAKGKGRPKKVASVTAETKAPSARR
ncbi:MAG: hypothetical protein HUU34_18785 [Saprospiraceae bacterium]|nr:hypothetical protein [Saprospiraceae bacterium]